MQDIFKDLLINHSKSHYKLCEYNIQTIYDPSTEKAAIKSFFGDLLFLMECQ